MLDRNWKVNENDKAVLSQISELIVKQRNEQNYMPLLMNT